LNSIRFILPLLILAPAGRGAELIRTVSENTAGVVAPRTLYISMETFPTDNLAFSLQAGVFPRLMAGIGYGGYNVTGMSTPDWFDKVYLKARFRFLDEQRTFPAFAVGFDNENEHPRGGGEYNRPERGFYLVASKNFADPIGETAFHLGTSFSPGNPRHLGFWMGMDKTLPAGFGLAADWDLGTDGDRSRRFDQSGGFLNFEVYWQSFGQVRISLQFRDVLETGGRPYRALAVDFLGLI